MSAAPQFPHDFRQPQEPPRPPHRRAWWKRVLGWTAAIIAALIVLVVIALVVLLRTSAGQRYVLRTVQEKVTAALGTNVRIGSYGLHFSGISPTVDLNNVVVAGAPPYTTPPLLTVDRLHVSVQIVSLLSQKWYLQDIAITHPVAHVFVDAHGTDNLPQTKSNQSSNQTSIFDLGVRHALLDRGEVYYNNRKSVLDADLHDVNFQSAFDTANRAYSGTLSYRNGHLKMENFNPLPHAMDAQFVATPTAFTLKRAVLTSGASQFILTATLQDYAHPKLRAQYQATVNSGEIRRILKNNALPSGEIHAAGSLDYAAKPDVPMLAAVVLNGTINSDALHVTTPSFRGDIRNIVAAYTVNHGNADIRNLHANLLGGALTGALTIRDLAGASRSHLTAALKGVSLADLKSMMNSPAMRQVALTGSVDANADATWGKTMDDMVARADATLHAGVAPATQAGNSVPVNGVVHARYAAASKEISLADSYLRLPQTSLTFDGTVSERSALAVRLQSNDLNELETIADEFRAPGSAPFGLYGQASFNGNVRGSTAAPQMSGQLIATNLRVKGSAWRLLRTNIEASPSFASLQNGELDAVQRGRVTFNLRTGLRKWAFTETSPIEVSLNASQLNAADLARAAGTTTPVSGTLSAKVSLQGTELNPVGQGQLTLADAKISGQPVQSLNANFNGNGDIVHANMTVHLPAGRADAVLTYLPRQQGYDAQLRAVGIRLAQLQAIKDRNLDLQGVLNITANGHGTLKDPGLNASLQIPKLTMHGQTVSGLSLQAAVANHVANVALDSSVINTQIHGRGRIALTGNYETNATLDTQPIQLEPLVALAAPSQAGNIKGQTELHATVRGPLKDKKLLAAQVVIPTLQVNFKNTVQIGAVQPIHLDYANGVLQLQRGALRGTDTDLQFQGTVPVASSQPMSLLLQGIVDLQLAQLMNPDISSSGQLRFNINSYGRRANPDVQGQINIVNASFATGDVPLGLQNGNGVLTLTKDRLDITHFTGNVGGGEVTMSGGVVYRPAIGFQLAMKSERVRLLYEGVRATVGSDLALTGSTDLAQLRGQVRVMQLQFAPDFDIQEFMGSLGGGASVPPPTSGFSNALRMDVGLVSSTGINLVSRTLSVAGNANLRITGTAAQPVILGRVNLNGGDLIFNGNRYTLQQATLDFVNPSQTQPVVNAQINTTIQQYNVQMHFWGPADHLHTSYSSDPALPPSDIINLVAFGKTSESAAANPSPPGQLGAESLVANQVSSQVTSRVSKVAGISQLSVDPLMGCDQQSRGACVTIQQRVTSKIFVTFGTDVTSTQRDTIKLEYQKSRRVSFSGTRDQNGGFGFDTRIHKDW
ncbi:MAG: translocation/assembly module TamB domain-containing protein [Terriglobales bacterium]